MESYYGLVNYLEIVPNILDMLYSVTDFTTRFVIIAAARSSILQKLNLYSIVTEF